MKPLIFLTTLFLVSTLTFANVEPKPSAVSKSLVFPVAGKKSNIGSFWGASREGGKRKHEGIDIFAKKGTPVLAICDGVIVSRTTTPKGGKVLWLRSSAHGLTAYYAHLDVQKAKVGQYVKKGEVIGTVGNTGNAKYTPSHLHFGIYTWKGAVNPLPYVKSSPKISAPVASKATSNIAKKNTSIQKPVVKKTVKERAPVQTTHAYVFPEKYIARTISVPADPSAKYYVTTRSNVVRIHNGNMQVIGKWSKGTAQYPYKITLANKKQLFINRTGQVTTAEGVHIGNVS